MNNITSNEAQRYLKMDEAARERRAARMNDWAEPMTGSYNLGQWSIASRKLEAVESTEADGTAAINDRLGAGASLDYPVLSYILRLYKRRLVAQRCEAVGSLLSAVLLWPVCLARSEEQSAEPMEAEPTDAKPGDAGGHVVPAPWWCRLAVC